MPVRAAGLRALITLGPLLASFGVAYLVAHRIAPPTGVTETIAWGLAVLVPSVVTVAALDRLARKLLPLQSLLTLSMAFPDRAPRRMDVARRAGDVDALKRQFEEMALETEGDPNTAAELVLSLVTALSAHDRRTRGHSERVRLYTDLIADSLRLPDHAKDRLRWASLLHDIGKLYVPADVLNKPGKPDPDEWAAIAQHPEIGAALAEPLKVWLGVWGQAIEHHHEHYDGNGYPYGLMGEEISPGGRIVAVADAFETMTAARPYRKPMRVSAARAELVRCSGTQFDPAVVRGFLTIPIRRLRWAAGILPGMLQIPFLPSLSPVIPRVAAGALAVVGGGAAATQVLPPPERPPAVIAGGPAAADDRAPDGSVRVGTMRPRNDPATDPAPVVFPRPTPTPTPTGPTGKQPAPAKKPGNLPPVVRSDSARTAEDTPVTIDVLANDVDPEGRLDRGSLSVLLSGATGTASVVSGKVRYTPRADHSGTDRFGYRVCDLDGACAATTVTITVTAVPDDPTAADDQAITLLVVPVTANVTANDSDPDGDLVRSSVTITHGPSNGSAVANDDGSITYTASLGFRGQDQLRYRVCDSRSVCDTAILKITVGPS